MSSANKGTSHENGKKNWKDVAELRMLAYIIPVAAVLAVIAILLGS